MECGKSGAPGRNDVVARLTEFYGCQCEHCKHCADEPETDDDLGFGPTFSLEMMVDGGHQENSAAFAVTFFGVFEPADLEDHASRFGHENAAAEDEQEFLADDDGYVAKQAAEGQRAGVAHEYGCGGAVEPEESEAGADHCAGDDGHLRASGNSGEKEDID